MSTLERSSRSADRPDVAVPTVTKLHRVERCTGLNRGTARHGRCPVYADTALDGHVLCGQHFAQALLSSDLLGEADHKGDGHCLREVLEQVLALLKDGVPDPSADQVLAAVPTAVLRRIEASLTGERREGLGARRWRLWIHRAGASAGSPEIAVGKGRRR